MRSVLSPAKIAALGLVPISSSRVPKAVRDRMKPMAEARTRKRRKGLGVMDQLIDSEAREALAGAERRQDGGDAQPGDEEAVQRARGEPDGQRQDHPERH